MTEHFIENCPPRAAYPKSKYLDVSMNVIILGERNVDQRRTKKSSRARRPF